MRVLITGGTGVLGRAFQPVAEGSIRGANADTTRNETEEP
jgi:hypothetical protein